MDNNTQPHSNLCTHGIHMGIGCRICEVIPKSEQKKEMVPVKKAIIELIEQLLILSKTTTDDSGKLSVILADIEKMKEIIRHY